MLINHHHKSHCLIKSFEAEELKKRPLVVKIADFFTSRFGTVGFLLLNIVVYGGWVFLNTYKVSWFPQVDPFPYSFMNSFVSIEAIILTVIVLMSQNRQNQTDSLRNELGLQVELISEREITKVLKLLKETLIKEKEARPDTELEEMLDDIDAGYIERKLQEQINKVEEKVIPKK